MYLQVDEEMCVCEYIYLMHVCIHTYINAHTVFSNQKAVCFLFFSFLSYKCKNCLLYSVAKFCTSTGRTGNEFVAYCSYVVPLKEKEE